MRTGVSGQIAISWSQTEIDGLEAAPLVDMVVGAAWSWRGRAIELTEGVELSFVRSETQSIVSLLGARTDLFNADQVVSESAKVVFTNGAQTFTAELVQIEGELSPILVFEGSCPKADQEYWIAAAAAQIEPTEIDRANGNKVVVFPMALTGVLSESFRQPKIAGIAAE